MATWQRPRRCDLLGTGGIGEADKAAADLCQRLEQRRGLKISSQDMKEGMCGAPAKNAVHIFTSFHTEE